MAWRWAGTEYVYVPGGKIWHSLSIGEFVLLTPGHSTADNHYNAHPLSHHEFSRLIICAYIQLIMRFATTIHIMHETVFMSESCTQHALYQSNVKWTCFKQHFNTFNKFGQWKFTSGLRWVFAYSFASVYMNRVLPCTCLTVSEVSPRIYINE